MATNAFKLFQKVTISSEEEDAMPAHFSLHVKRSALGVFFGIGALRSPLLFSPSHCNLRPMRGPRTIHVTWAGQWRGPQPALSHALLILLKETSHAQSVLDGSASWH